MPPAVGLDFGTTNSAIAVTTPDGSTHLATFQIDGQVTTTFRSSSSMISVINSIGRSKTRSLPCQRNRRIHLCLTNRRLISLRTSRAVFSKRGFATLYKP